MAVFRVERTRDYTHARPCLHLPRECGRYRKDAQETGKRGLYGGRQLRGADYRRKPYAFESRTL